MRALTIRQPWATLIATGAKTIETRSWSTKYRGPLAIHAGAHRPATFWHHRADDDIPAAIDLVSMSPFWEWTENVDDYTAGCAYRWIGPLGAVVAVAELVDVVPMIEDPLADPDGPFVWVDPDFVQIHDGPDDLAPRYSELERHLGDFAEGRWAWLLENVQPIDPIPAKGRQGLWTVDHDLAFDLELAR